MPPADQQQILTYFALCVGGFVVGSLPFGFWMCKLLKGVDLRCVGSGNIGATNAFRAAGPGVGIIVLILDVAKGAAPALVGGRIGGPELAVVAGALAVAGHSFSPFLRFRGGKGVATALGMLAGVTPVTAGVALATFAVAFALFRIVSLSSLLGALACVVTVVWRAEPRSVQVLVALVGALIIIRHRANIVRLLRRQEPKFRVGEKAGTSKSE